MLLPQSIYRFDDRETFVYPGNIQIGTVASYQFLSTMPAHFAVQQNVTGATFTKGAAIARGPAAVGFILADNSIDVNKAIGLACEFSEAGRGAIVQLSGPFCLFDWTEIAGTVQLLPRTTYYLDSVPGKITPTPPGSPDLIQRIGYSLSPFVLNLTLESYSEIVAIAGGGTGLFGNLDGGDADEIYGGVVLSPIDGGGA